VRLGHVGHVPAGVCHWHGGRAGAPKANVNGLKHGGRTPEAEIERKMAKGIRMAVKAVAKVSGKTKKGRLSPEVGEGLLKELRETFTFASSVQGSAARSRMEKLRRKKEEAS